jgi:hypothetical protein
MLEKKPYRLLLPVISGLSYGLGALTISWVMARLFNEGALDRSGVRYWALLFAYKEDDHTMNEGMDHVEPRTPESTIPTSFRQWCEEVLKPAVVG